MNLKVRSDSFGSHLRFNGPGEGEEDGIGVLRFLGTCLEEDHVLGFRIVGTLVVGYLSVIFQVAFVAYQQLDGLFRRMKVRLIQPGLYVFKALGIGNVIHQNDAMSRSKEGVGNRTWIDTGVSTRQRNLNCALMNRR